MGRPKRFPHLSDEAPRLSADEGMHFQPAAMEGRNPIEAKRIKTLTNATARSHVVVSGYYDPNSIACVINAILRLENDTRLTARALATIMSDHYRQYRWPPIVVGRILSDLAGAADDSDLDPPPIRRVAGRGGYRYVVTPNTANWEWFSKVHALFNQLMDNDIAIERAGNETHRRHFPFTEIARFKPAS